MTILSLAGSFLVGLVRSLPTWVVSGLATAGVLLLLYEGVPPFPVKIPFIGEISLIDGRVDRIRKESDERCRLQKVESRRLADRADTIRERDAAETHAEQVTEMGERALAAQDRARDHERTISKLDAALQACRRATPADDARVSGG